MARSQGSSLLNSLINNPDAVQPWLALTAPIIKLGPQITHFGPLHPKDMIRP
jgi:hypothetical protein